MNDQNRSVFAFSRKSSWEHFRAFFARPIQIAVIAAACFGSLWTIFEATVSSFALKPDRTLPYVVFVVFSIAVAVAWRFYEYINKLPEGLHGISRNAKRIAHIQRPKWEFQFAKSVLAQLLGPIDRECKDLIEGRAFVIANPLPNIREYFAWLTGRPDNLLRMLEVSKRLMLHEFTSALRSTKNNRANPEDILASCIAIQRLYAEAVAFERASLSVLPPRYFDSVHKLQLGWTQPIRDAIHQLFQFLQTFCDANANAHSELEFTIEYQESANVDEFCAALAELETQLPQILQEEWGA